MDDRFMKELGALQSQREEEAEKARLDERWDRLAAGTLTAEEEAELKALAGSSLEAREAYAAFQPLGAEFQTQMIREIKTLQAKEARVRWLRQLTQNFKAWAAKVFFPRGTARRLEIWGGVAAAVVATVFFPVYYLMRTSDTPLSSHYEIIASGQKENRGGETAPQDEKRVYSPGALFDPEMEIRPKRPLEHPVKVKVRAFLSSSAGSEDLKLLGLEDKFESAETGSARLDPEATIKIGEDIKARAGDWILWTVVTAGSLPEAPKVQDDLRTRWPKSKTWQDICDALQKEETPPPARSQVACIDFRIAD